MRTSPRHTAKLSSIVTFVITTLPSFLPESCKTSPAQAPGDVRSENTTAGSAPRQPSVRDTGCGSRGTYLRAEEKPLRRPGQLSPGSGVRSIPVAAGAERVAAPREVPSASPEQRSPDSPLSPGEVGQPPDTLTCAAARSPRARASRGAPVPRRGPAAAAILLPRRSGVVHRSPPAPPPRACIAAAPARLCERRGVRGASGPRRAGRCAGARPPAAGRGGGRRGAAAAASPPPPAAAASPEASPGLGQSGHRGGCAARTQGRGAQGRDAREGRSAPQG